MWYYCSVQKKRPNGTWLTLTLNFHLISFCILAPDSTFLRATLKIFVFFALSLSLLLPFFTHFTFGRLRRSFSGAPGHVSMFLTSFKRSKATSAMKGAGGGMHPGCKNLGRNCSVFCHSYQLCGTFRSNCGVCSCCCFLFFVVIYFSSSNRSRFPRSMFAPYSSARKSCRRMQVCGREDQVEL